MFDGFEYFHYQPSDDCLNEWLSRFATAAATRTINKLKEYVELIFQIQIRATVVISNSGLGHPHHINWLAKAYVVRWRLLPPRRNYLVVSVNCTNRAAVTVSRGSFSASPFCVDRINIVPKNSWGLRRRPVIPVYNNLLVYTDDPLSEINDLIKTWDISVYYYRQVKKSSCLKNLFA